MSNVAPEKLHVVMVKDELLDFVSPVYTINAPSSLKSFNAQDIQTYSNAYVNATLNLNSTDFVCDPAILQLQPITFTIAGTNTINPGTSNLLVDGCWSLRSNALFKMVNTLEVKLGSTSNTVNLGDTLSALERYNNFTYDKFINNYGLSYLDQTQSYNDLIGSSKNPMGLFSSGTDIIEPRGSWPCTVVNGPTTATIHTVLRMLIPISPLVDKIRRDGSPVVGLSHLSNITFNETFYPNSGVRGLSFADIQPSGNVLSISNIGVSIEQPTFAFVQIKCRNEMIPRVLSYPLISQERYIFEKPLRFQIPTVINVASFNLTRVPQSMVIYARPSNSALLNSGGAGAFIPDAFAQLSQLTVQYDGQTLFSQSVPEQLYSMAVSNGLSDTFTQWAGDGVIKTNGIYPATDPAYIYPVGSVLKMDFGKDISLYPGICVGAYNECAISLQVTATSNCSYTTSFEFYMVMLYSDVIQLYDNNLAQISNIPVSYSDIQNAHASEHAHRVHLRNPDVVGAGLMSSAKNFIKSGKLEGVIKGIKSALSSNVGKAVRNDIKGYLRSHGRAPEAGVLEAIGFGDEAMDGGAKLRRKSKSKSMTRTRSKSVKRKPGRPRRRSMKGGAYASMTDLAESLYD